MTLVTDILKQMPRVRQPQQKFLATLFATILKEPGSGCRSYWIFSRRETLWNCSSKNIRS